MHRTRGVLKRASSGLVRDATDVEFSVNVDACLLLDNCCTSSKCAERTAIGVLERSNVEIVCSSIVRSMSWAKLRCCNLKAVLVCFSEYNRLSKNKRL